MKRKQTAKAAEKILEKPAKPVRAVSLKQYMVSETFAEGEPPRETKAAFILQTCALNARKEFEQRFGLKAGQCMQTAESPFVKEDLARHDFWKEKLNWDFKSESRKQSSQAKQYFKTKEKAQKVQKAKREAGITDWETATDTQREMFSKLMTEKNK